MRFQDYGIFVWNRFVPLSVLVVIDCEERACIVLVLFFPLEANGTQNQNSFVPRKISSSMVIAESHPDIGDYMVPGWSFVGLMVSH